MLSIYHAPVPQRIDNTIAGTVLKRGSDVIMWVSLAMVASRVNRSIYLTPQNIELPYPSQVVYWPISATHAHSKQLDLDTGQSVPHTQQGILGLNV